LDSRRRSRPRPPAVRVDPAVLYVDEGTVLTSAGLTATRLRTACTVLETGDLTVEEIARRSRLGSAANLRLRFRQTYATTPLAYRRTFQNR
jgi:transcriptional regulator GlxA family with amidase domain